jgi:Ulp1 family protease
LLFFIIRIWRKERHLEDCPVHFFTTHFYTALEEGPDKVASWTEKNIDVFKKKRIFIPINKSLHWSLCCVVNPGAILNNVKELNKNPGDDEPYPCILFFDSMRAHRKLAIVNNVRDWLNLEWTRLGRASTPDKKDPFKHLSLQVHELKGK